MNKSPVAIRATSSDTAVVETAQSDDVIFKEIFPVQRIEKVFSIAVHSHI